MTDKTDFDYQHLAVDKFMTLGNQSCPPSPSILEFSIRELRAKLVLEEALETVHALGFDALAFDGGDLITEPKFIPTRDCNLIQIADGCADLKVVTVGTEIACGINGKPVFLEVMRSNMTKDFSGAKRPDGKILKGPTYEPPNIERVLQLQGWKP